MARNHERDHSHSHSGDGNIGAAFFLNLSFTVIEFIGGAFTNSVAIFSDAVHDFGDCLSLAMAWYFQRKSKKGSTSQYTYGYKRFSLLGAIITSVVLTAGSLYIISKAIPRLISPQKTHAGGMLLLAVAGIIANGIAVLRTRKAKSINERAVSLHLLEDVLGWAAVLIGSAVMYFTGLTVIDPVLSVLIACFVLFNVVKNVRLALPILLQSVPAEIERGHIIERLDDNEHIKNVHDLHIWSLDEEYNVLTVHVTLREPLSAEKTVELKKAIRLALREEDIHHATIEIEQPDEICDFLNCV